MQLVTFSISRSCDLSVCFSFAVHLLVSLRTTTWCQEWLSICELLTATVSSANQADSYSCFTLVGTNMAELAGLLISTVDWHSPDALQVFKKFKAQCKLFFPGPLKEKSQEEQNKLPSCLVG